MLPFQGGEIDPLEDNLAGVGRIEPGDGTGDGGLAGARLPHQTESLTLEDLEADVVAGAHVLAAAREDGILGDELQIHVLHPQQRAFIGALVLTLAEPVGLEIDAGIRRTGILDIGDQGEAYQLDIRAGNRRDEAAGIGVIGAAQHLFRGAELHQIAAVHHRHLVGNVGDHPHVMSHQHAADLALFAQVADELEDLILDGDVQRRGRLIGDDELGIPGEGDGDHHPLAHATGELVRILLDAHVRVRDPHRPHQLEGLGKGRLAGQVGVGEDGLHQLLLHGEQRIEGGHGILEDETDARATNGPHLVLALAGDELAVEVDVTTGDATGRAQQIDDGVADGGFASAGLTDDADDLALFNRKREILDRGKHPVAGGVLDPQVFDFKQGHGYLCGGHPSQIIRP